MPSAALARVLEHVADAAAADRIESSAMVVRLSEALRLGRHGAETGCGLGASVDDHAQRVNDAWVVVRAGAAA